MSSRSQKKAERHAKKRKEKRKHHQQASGPQQQPFDGSESEYFPLGRVRHPKVTPVAWAGESVEDVAVFSDAALATVSHELQVQIRCVRDALAEILNRRGPDALERLTAVPRTSPVAEWRLFLRGLVAWLANQIPEANDCWIRLNPERRPGRIASVMIAAGRTDLESVQPEQAVPATSETAAPLIAEPESRAPLGRNLDPSQLAHARILRRLRIERPILRMLSIGLEAPDPEQYRASDGSDDEEFELKIGEEKLRWLARHLPDLRDSEPDLYQALCDAILGRAFDQPIPDVFEQAMRMIPGPPHDKSNRLLAAKYFLNFGPANGWPHSLKYLKTYVECDLKGNESISAALRAALASHAYLYVATEFGKFRYSPMFMYAIAAADEATVRNLYLNAITACATNRRAYIAYENWLRRFAWGDDADERLERDMRSLLERWVAGRPEDIEPRLKLVDYQLENGELAQAQVHVDFLASCRHDDPLVRALPWKLEFLHLREASKRKASVDEAQRRLNTMEATWPAWLPKAWLPYFRAALALRAGKKDEFKILRNTDGQGPMCRGLADAAMMLGACQILSIPAATLKTIRAELEEAFKRQRPPEELIELGSSFWDLKRMGITFSSQRKLARNFIHDLQIVLGKMANVAAERIQDERFLGTVCWLSEDESQGFSYDSGKVLRQLCKGSPPDPVLSLAARFYESGEILVSTVRKQLPQLRNAAASHPNPFYRMWLQKRVEDVEDHLRRIAPW